MSPEELNRRIRAAREMLPEDPAWSQDYPLDWPDAPLPESKRRAERAALWWLAVSIAALPLFVVCAIVLKGQS